MCGRFFFQQVWPSTEKFILQRSSLQKVLPACENQLPSSWKRQWNPYPPPPSPPSLTAVPLTRHYDKYSINHGLQQLTGERLFWLPVPRKSISPYASVCICRVHLSGVHWSPVSSLATFKSCWFLVLPHIHIGFLTWKKGILSNSETYFLFHS